MSFSLGSNIANFPAISIGTTSVLKISLGEEQIWPGFDPVLTPITSTGAFSYTVPDGANFVDVVLLGAGGGGMGMGLATAWGQGGRAGQWQLLTLQVGVDIAAGATITGSVGSGGSAGAGGLGGGSGGTGGSTTANIPGYGTLTALGGAGGTSRNLDVNGKSPGNQTLHDQTYVGGAESLPLAAAPPGNAPGGGGAASQFSTIQGGAGARGQAWFFAF
ncbi:hypothetical protein PBI_MISSWHITE_32 [Mycobacterium phage MissWhite]|nr:hypothetical protein PBI_MISSWHITE_32 [Mycobacterium phage MissWhite]